MDKFDMPMHNVNMGRTKKPGDDSGHRRKKNQGMS